MKSFTNTRVYLLKGSVLAVCAVGVLGLVGCSAPSQTGESVQASANSVSIKIDGSSTVYPISDAIAKEYLKTNGSKAQIDVQFSGTRAGFNKFCTGETDISDASRPILLRELEVCVKSGVAFIEIPIAFDALTIAVNPKNDWATDITIDELKTMWEPLADGKIKNWNQIRASYPNRPLKLWGAGKDSGTYEYFNEAVIGNPEASRSDYTGSEDDNAIAQGIEQDPGALGYLPYAYYEANQQRLKALAIDSGRGSVLPARQSVEKAEYQPFARPLFIYVNAKAAQEKPALKAFVEYYLTHAGRVSTTVGYIPLPAEGYRLATIQFTRGEIGTVFEGISQPNVTIAELLRRQAVFQLSETRPGEQ
ncbi:MAG: PstS family phosphate ABC transporter substrate-binding protein [Leptolyngbyaceae cyanobacterium RU_5_1]|nr:PstS family phosphate ABC transporter substrate-binding protein [Leptolyngbyaceae cyanobacterium RU_5_1]